MVKIAVITGGPSLERGISLNSARSFIDHAETLGIELVLLYVDTKLDYYELTRAQLYSNTPLDFDFKLSHVSSPLKQEALIQRLKEVDRVFPLIHGAYGEDGTLQALLETHGIPFIGSPSAVCREVFNKYACRKLLEKNGFPVLPYAFLSEEGALETFWKEHRLEKAVIKPVSSGSSLGVITVHSVEEAKAAVADLTNKGFHELLIEPFCEEKEFTLCVIENREGQPVSLIPLEIDTDGIFSYRKKYMPSDSTRYYCPPRFSDDLILEIRKEAEKLFAILELKDMARIDGWVTAEGKIYFSDLNPISGMEQNSFIFQQAARVGLSHGELLAYLLKLPPPHLKEKKKKVFVLMGGNSSERQVSLMSGTNVWLKLLHSSYEPIPFLMAGEVIWQLPYAFTLHHTVEEMSEHCERAEEVIEQADPHVKNIRQSLGLSPYRAEKPIRMDLEGFIERAQQENAFVFIALHGGVGEDGTLQQRLEEANLSFNGCSASASALCMDKHQTSLSIRALQHPEILGMPQISFNIEEDRNAIWEKAESEFGITDLIIKPQCDGCSTGVVRLRSFEEFSDYLDALEKGGRYREVDMPVDRHQPFLLEPYVKADKIAIVEKSLQKVHESGWCEMTIGVLEERKQYQALYPSITVAENHVLSVEEKFQGGTGVNITPPPSEILPPHLLQKVQASACRIAEVLGIQGYARLDLFVECTTGAVKVIEANTLPALTPSTVLYHQAFCETPPLSPRELLSRIISFSDRPKGENVH